MTDVEAWDLLLNAEVTFSPNCRSGLLARCECYRCRQSRGEPVTVETEQRASEDAKRADEEYERRQAEWRANRTAAMATPFERVKAAWGSPNRESELNRVVEAMASEGVARDELDNALGQLLDEVRDAGADDETEEIINNVGDRLHGWCHESRRVDFGA